MRGNQDPIARQGVESSMRMLFHQSGHVLQPKDDLAGRNNEAQLAEARQPGSLGLHCLQRGLRPQPKKPGFFREKPGFSLAFCESSRPNQPDFLRKPRRRVKFPFVEDARRMQRVRIWASFNRDPSGSARSEACTSHALPDGSRLNDFGCGRAAFERWESCRCIVSSCALGLPRGCIR